MRIAIVGVGSIGSRHIDTLLSMGYQDLVGIDPRPMPDDERLPIVESFEDVDGWKPTHALICSPPESHYHHAKHFLERGVATFIEKPMTEARIEAVALNALAENEGAVLAVGYMERAHPIVQQAKDWARANKPTFAEVFCYWRATPKTYALDVAAESSHAIDTALYIMGDAADVRRRGGVQVRSHIELMHEKARTEVIMDMDASPRRRIQLYTENLYAFSMDYGTTAEEWDACYKAELQAFLDGKPLCTGEDGLKVVEVLEQLK